MRRSQSKETCATILAVILLAAAGSLVVRAQTSDGVARQLDEFGILQGCDSGARLDNLAIEMQNNPNIRGHIICYGPQGEGSGTAANILESIRYYFVEMRGFSPDRVVTTNGGRYSRNDVKIELWIVPEGAVPPQPTHSEQTAGEFTGKFIEYETQDGFMFSESMGGIYYGDIAFASLAEALRQQPTSRAYFVSYAGRNSDGESPAPGAAARIARREVGEFLRGYNIEASRVTTIVGGRGERTKIEIYVLPSDSPPPIAESRDRETFTEAAMIGNFERFILDDEHRANWARDSFVEMLRANHEASGYIIIRLPHRSVGEETEDGTSEVGGTPQENVSTNDMPPEIDLQQLAERWRSDLIARQGIEPHRVTVIIGRSRGWETGTLETWIVPLGAIMPDPNVIRDEESFEETEQESEQQDPSVQGAADGRMERTQSPPQRL